METKTHWRNFHNPEYIGAYAFNPNERKVLTIKAARQEGVMGQSGKKEDCLVVHFDEAEKPLICNVTNSKAISAVCGSSYIEDWPGNRIELFVTEVSAFGSTVEAVRVKPTKPKAVSKPALTPQHDAWDKVVAAVAGGYTKAQVLKKYAVSDGDWDLIEAEAEMLNDKNAENHG